VSKDLYDWSTFTAGESAPDLLGNLIRWSFKTGVKPKTKWTARALTDLTELNALQAHGLDGANSPGSGNRRYWFKARIIGPDSPHSFIPDPCDPAYAEDLDYVYKLISMHTSFISANSDASVAPVTRGDIVSVEVDISNDRYQLQYGKYLKLLSIEDPPESLAAECGSLVKLFGKIEHKPLPNRKQRRPGTTFRPTSVGAALGGTPHGIEDCLSSGPGNFSRIKLNKAELASLLEPLAPLIDFIVKGESGGNFDHEGYSAVNKDREAATPKQSREFMNAAFGTQDLRTVRVGQVKAAGQAGKIFAAGRFQIIPATLRTAQRLVPEVKNNDLFNEETQNALGAALIFLKRPSMGNYLLGLHDKICVAQIAAALEWSSLPLPIDYPKLLVAAPGNGPPAKPWTFDASGKYGGRIRCQKGGTAYCNSSDRAGHGTGEFEQMLRTTREAVLRHGAYARLKAGGRIPTGA
jgi:hypothetical protein